MARRRVINEPETTTPTTDDTSSGDVDPRKESMARAAVKADEFAKAKMADHKAKESERNGKLVGVDAVRMGTFPKLDGNEKETVTATWGEELFTPRQFCSFRVGPYTATTIVQAGETRVEAGQRLMRELHAISELERETKRKAFMEALEDVFHATQKAERSS